jgi:7,8-dihydro-6-hydroxymethylpterin-pyrophosphokinase
MHEREFVLRGLAEIAPEAMHPVLGKAAGQMQQEVLEKNKGT